MNLILKTQIMIYIKKVKHHIPADYQKKEELLHTIQQNINTFLYECPKATFQDIKKEFGTPAEIAASALEELSGLKIAATIQREEKGLHIFITLCAICAILFLAVIHYVHYWRNEEASVVEETLYIYDDTEAESEIIEKLLNLEEPSEN